MRILYIFFLLSIIIFFACSNEDELDASYKDINWFVIHDDPDSELNHVIYEVYKKSNIPIFYNDTIGAEERGTDSNGRPYIYYHMLRLQYSVSGVADHKYVLSKNETDILAGVKLLDEFAIPLIPSYITPPTSFLLVDTLYYKLSNAFYDHDCYAGLMSTSVGKLSSIKNMSNEEKRIFGSEIIGTYIADILMREFPLEVDDFHKISRENSYVNNNIRIYQGANPAYYPVYKHWFEYGYLHRNYFQPYEEDESYYTPLKEFDLTAYAGLILSMTEAEIEETYGEYSFIMRKSAFVRELITKLNQ